MRKRPSDHTTVHLAESLRVEILAEARRAYPAEACGFLIGRTSAAGVEIVRTRAAANRSTRRNRYSIDPLDQLAAATAARRDSLDVVGVWHSHPDRSAEPSRTDLEEAWEGLSYVIVSLDRDGPAEIRSWRLAGETFHEELLLESRASGADAGQVGYGDRSPG